MALPAQLRSWSDARTPRERVLLGAALALALAWLAFAMAWQPLQRSRDLLIDRIGDRDRMLAVLEASGPLVDTTPRDDRPVPVIVAESSTEFGLAIRRLEPDGPGVRITLAEAPFDDVIGWLAALEQDYGLSLSGLEMTRQPAPGIVGTTLSLTR